jgi:mono/diheme cytochrome c family protein
VRPPWQFLSFGLLALVCAGCRQDMQNQPKFVPQRSTTFFADGRSVRPQVTHTVARGQLDEDSFFYTGLIDGKEADAMPFPASMAVLERGQERFNIYCTPCHSRVGNGAGMIVQRGYKAAGNFHSARILAEPLGHYFYVMTNGYGAMPDYASQITPADRWAVAAYIRALQVSQNARENDVPSGTQVENLGDIAEREGLPASFAEPWTLPPTAVSALPPDPGQGNPGNAPATGDSAFPGMSQPGSGPVPTAKAPNPARTR